MNKKATILLIVLTMIFTSLVPSFSYGEKQYGKKLEEVILKTKKLFEITSEYDKFNSNISEYDGRTIFNLSWQDSKKKLGNINITADIDGNIISFDNYVDDYNRVENKVPKYSRDQAQEIAMSFINKVSPDIKAIKLSEDTGLDNLNDVFYNFTYFRYVDEIKYREDTININVNKYTGEVSNYYVNWDRDIEFPSTDKIIEMERAKTLFKEKIGLKLLYKINREDYRPIDMGSVENEYYLAYSVIEPDKGIDALTGEKINVNYYGPYYGNEGMGGEAAVENDISPEEQESIDQLKNILSEEKAQEKARQAIGIDDDYKLQDQNLYKSYKNSTDYIWDMYFVNENKDNDSPNVNIGIDAKTGELLSFYKNLEQNGKGKDTISKERALELARTYLDKQIPDKKDKIELIDDMNNYIDLNIEPKIYNFRFIRKEKEVYVEDDNIYIGLDAVSGDIISYSIDWYKGEFPKKDSIISIDEAYKILWKEIGLELMYVKVQNENISSNTLDKDNAVVKLAYMLNSDKPSIIDAKTGDILDYSGKPYKEMKAISYNDIENSYARDKIKTLAKYGIGLKGESFLPKEKIKQGEYISLLWKSIEQNRFEELSQEELYNRFIRSGYMLENEKNPDAIVTKAESVKYIIRIMNLEEVAKLQGIYKDIFKDQSEIEQGFKGYINLAYGLKILNGNGTGNINPKAELKREDAANIIYNYIFR